MILFFILFFLNLDASDIKYSHEVYSVINDTQIISEGSAILKSASYDILWTINDSGDVARIFAIDLKGNIIKPSWVKKYSGIKIVDAHNIDWEAITQDEDGNILICDCGNNYNYRRDLAIYKIQEPNPYYADKTSIIAKYPFKLSDQKKFPPENELEWNFDIEAMFEYNEYIYLISKNRGNTKAKIYRLKDMRPWEINIFELYNEFDFKSMVTDASVSPDKKHLAVLSYDYIWVFETHDKNPFGKSYYKKISLNQCEGVSFINNNEIIISNEDGYLFKLDIKDIKNER